MSALNFLSSLLQPAVQAGAQAMTEAVTIDTVLGEMSARSKSTGKGHLSEDHQLDAVRRFWESQEIATFRDAYLLSWGLCHPHRLNGPCVMEDRPRFQRVLDGVDSWTVKPSAYRRCYQGLVKSYFTYDVLSDNIPNTAKYNWRLLRQYLRDNNKFIRDQRSNPDWVDIAIGNQQLFGERPCDPYVDALLKGDTGSIDYLCEQLGISKASWFLRELVLAQVVAATKLGDPQFQALIPRLLELLASNEVLRDRGLIPILDRYVRVPGSQLHQSLRDASVQWWGNPWLPSNVSHWGGVVPAARTMVADWLKLQFIETFFTKLAEDGLGDKRRMNFWKRYVQSISHIEFALGSTARNSRDRDMVALRKKMNGLICELDASGINNAFIMTMGNLVVVEFSGMGNALYGYDPQRALPFDTSQTLRLAGDLRNSLKQKSKSILWLSHQDGIHNWDKWEHMFEATLRKEFGIESGKAQALGTLTRARTATPPPTSDATALQQAADVTQPYSRSVLNKFANAQGFQVDDKTAQGGSLWVRTEADDPHVTKILTKWGFHHKPGKGWWK
jgi:hypothetical protein